MIPVANPLDFSRAGTDGYSQGASIPVKWHMWLDGELSVVPHRVTDAYLDDDDYLEWLGFPRKQKRNAN